MDFSKKCPHLAWWIENHGWIELGPDMESDSLIRILDEGGNVWEDEEAETIDEALQNAESFLAADLPERMGADFNLDE